MLTPRFARLAALALVGCATAPTTPAVQAEGVTTHGAHDPPVVEARSSLPPPALDPARGAEVGQVYEAFLSPQQEPDEEQNTPSTVPSAFRSTTPSLTRAQRVEAGHRGHGVIRFSRDLSRAWIDVRVEGIDASTVNMFHVHCGRPGILGPILLDFALTTDLQRNLSDGVLSVEVTNQHIAATAAHGHSPLSLVTQGCMIPSPSLGGAAPTRVSTIAGMAAVAAEGELYFNLHTTGQTYYGDIRGQILRAEPAPSPATAP
ncbi:MAG: CHRD domain-containing protein [Polyangiales bacterium]